MADSGGDGLTCIFPLQAKEGEGDEDAVLSSLNHAARTRLHAMIGNVPKRAVAEVKGSLDVEGAGLCRLTVEDKADARTTVDAGNLEAYRLTHADTYNLIRNILELRPYVIDAAHLKGLVGRGSQTGKVVFECFHVADIISAKPDGVGINGQSVVLALPDDFAYGIQIRLR